MRSTHLSSPLSRIFSLTRRYLTTRPNYASILLPVAVPTKKKFKPRLNIDSQICMEINDWSLICMSSLFYNLGYKNLTFMLASWNKAFDITRSRHRSWNICRLSRLYFFLSTNLKICILGQMISKVQAQALFGFKKALRIWSSSCWLWSYWSLAEEEGWREESDILYASKINQVLSS